MAAFQGRGRTLNDEEGNEFGRVLESAQGSIAKRNVLPEAGGAAGARSGSVDFGPGGPV